MTNERRDLIMRLAVASFPTNPTLSTWISECVNAADYILAALDKESPPAQAAADHTTIAPSQEGAGSATAASGGELHQHTDACWEPTSGCDLGRNEKYARVSSAEPQERTCAWTKDTIYLWIAGCNGLTWPTSTAYSFCPDCGGKIITEAT